MEILGDFKTSVIRALGEIDENWEKYDGLVVCGSHNPSHIEETINKITNARMMGTPFLGICFGHQLANIEWAINVMGIKDATSEEFGEGTNVVIKLPSLNVGEVKGESYWNNYVVREDVLISFLRNKPDSMITCQFHPEYESCLGNPHPLLVKFLDLCRK